MPKKKKSSPLSEKSEFETYTYTIFHPDFFGDKNPWIFKSQSSAEKYFMAII